MHYMLMFNETPAALAKRDDAAHAKPYWGSWTAFIGAMNAAGVMVKGDGLKLPETATTLRIRDGKRSVQDGPFADTKEALGGYVVLDVPNLDVALDWAAKAPCVHEGSVEIRPVLPPPAGGA